jgi:hypothetical protein
MPNLIRFVIVCFSVVLASGSDGFAQQTPRADRCETLAAKAEDTSRETALEEAWEAILEVADPKARRIWDDRGMRVGEAPGFQVTRIVTRCSQIRGGYTCQIEATLCRQ